MSEIDWAKLEKAIAQSDAKRSTGGVSFADGEDESPSVSSGIGGAPAVAGAVAAAASSPLARRRSVTGTLRSMFSRKEESKETTAATAIAAAVDTSPSMRRRSTSLVKKEDAVNKVTMRTRFVWFLFKCSFVSGAHLWARRPTTRSPHRGDLLFVSLIC
jgi:hypothetical protein